VFPYGSVYSSHGGKTLGGPLGTPLPHPHRAEHGSVGAWRLPRECGLCLAWELQSEAGRQQLESRGPPLPNSGETGGSGEQPGLGLRPYQHAVPSPRSSESEAGRRRGCGQAARQGGPAAYQHADAVGREAREVQPEREECRGSPRGLGHHGLGQEELACAHASHVPRGPPQKHSCCQNARARPRTLPPPPCSLGETLHSGNSNSSSHASIQGVPSKTSSPLPPAPPLPHPPPCAHPHTLGSSHLTAGCGHACSHWTCLLEPAFPCRDQPLPPGHLGQRKRHRHHLVSLKFPSLSHL